MSIVVSSLKTEIRNITRKDNTTDFSDSELSALLLEACIEISKRLLCLKSSTTGTLSASTNTITKPTDMVDAAGAIDDLYLDENQEDPISFAEWRAGWVKGYAYRDVTIYVNPTSTNSRSYTLYYRAEHGSLSTNLEFDDALKGAVKWLTCQKVYDRHEQWDMSQPANQRYEREIAMNAPCEPTFTRMRKTRE